MFDNLAREVLSICDEIASFSSLNGKVRRYCMTPEMDSLHKYLQRLFNDTCYSEKDKVGNILFRNRIENQKTKVLIGSHLDTVSNAGNYDGVLGVVLGLVVAREFNGGNLDFNVVGFADE